MSALPFDTAPEWRVSIEGRPAADGGSAPTALDVMVGSQDFEALGLRLLRGRTFSAVDGTLGHEAAIVNERFASLHFAGANALASGSNHPSECASRNEGRRVLDHRRPADRATTLRGGD